MYGGAEANSSAFTGAIKVECVVYSSYNHDNLESSMLNRLLLAITLVLSFSGIAHAQGTVCTTLTLRGTLIIPVQDYPSRFEVLLLSRRGEQEFAHSYVDMTNRFFMDNLQQGEYDVVVRLPGFKELRERVEVEQHQGNESCIVNEIYWLTPEDTVVIVDERLRGYPKEAIDEFVLAITAESDKHYEQVVQHLEKVVKLAADWFDAHCELGAAYEEVHHPGDAEKEYRTALTLKPESFRVMMSLGRLFVVVADEKLQDPSTRDSAVPIFHQAYDLLAAAAERDPTSAMAMYMVGNTEFRLASYKDAERDLKRALELDATIYPARISLVNVYIAQNMWQDALENLDEFIIGNPTAAQRQEALATRTAIIRRLNR